ncbi:MAG: GNAT family N-acetyltransferase [Phycisphaerae bacterium]|nr:GNAT family N-acetyltransferase [Phycisphaerae bacterium]
MSQNIVVRLAGASDGDVIVAFNRAMALETEGKVLAEEISSRGVAGLFANPSLGFYVVAENGGEVIGSLMITTEWSDWRAGSFWWVQSVYVRPEARRQGVYRSLYRFVGDMADKDPDVCGFRLYVERENSTARQAYKALGMEETNYVMFEELKDGIDYYR